MCSYPGLDVYGMPHYYQKRKLVVTKFASWNMARTDGTAVLSFLALGLLCILFGKVLQPVLQMTNLLEQVLAGQQQQSSTTLYCHKTFAEWCAGPGKDVEE